MKKSAGLLELFIREEVTNNSTTPPPDVYPRYNYRLNAAAAKENGFQLNGGITQFIKGSKEKVTELSQRELERFLVTNIGTVLG